MSRYSKVYGCGQFNDIEELRLREKALWQIDVGLKNWLSNKPSPGHRAAFAIGMLFNVITFALLFKHYDQIPPIFGESTVMTCFALQQLLTLGVIVALHMTKFFSRSHAEFIQKQVDEYENEVGATDKEAYLSLKNDIASKGVYATRVMKWVEKEREAMEAAAYEKRSNMNGVPA